MGRFKCIERIFNRLWSELAPQHLHKATNPFDKLWNGRDPSIQMMRDPEMERLFTQIMNKELSPKQANAAMRQIMATLMVRNQAMAVADTRLQESLEQQKRADAATHRALRKEIRHTERSVEKTRAEIRRFNQGTEELSRQAVDKAAVNQTKKDENQKIRDRIEDEYQKQKQLRAVLMVAAGATASIGIAKGLTALSGPIDLANIPLPESGSF